LSLPPPGPAPTTISTASWGFHVWTAALEAVAAHVMMNVARKPNHR
jgi:hypothetical protein